MNVVIDGLPITGQSLAIVIEHLLEGWAELERDDQLHLVLGPDAELAVADGVHVHRVSFGSRAAVSRLRGQNLFVPKLCRQLGADVMLGVLPTTVVAPLPCPRALIAYDLRHEQRPEQFSRQARMMRTLSYNLGFRQADAILCISDRTRHDLLAGRPWLRNRIVKTALLGGDHVQGWPVLPEAARGDYALAFGQYGNKNVDLVIDAWAELRNRGVEMPLSVVGLGREIRPVVQAKVDSLGLNELITVSEWLSDHQFRARFTGAAMVVFPSDFEGFGMPAVEAMRLGLPLVITPEKALLEVTGGHATVMDGWDSIALADAVVAARDRNQLECAEATTYAERFTWRRTAEDTRTALAEAVQRTGHAS